MVSVCGGRNVPMRRKFDRRLHLTVASRRYLRYQPALPSGQAGLERKFQDGKLVSGA
jgi:hypothetical protein